MDPFTAIGLASAIVLFVDFGTKLLGGAREIYFSTTRSTAQNATLEIVVTEIRAWASRLTLPGLPCVQSDEERAICSLAKECQRLSKRILELIEKNETKEAEI